MSTNGVNGANEGYGAQYLKQEIQQNSKGAMGIAGENKTDLISAGENIFTGSTQDAVQALQSEYGFSQESAGMVINFINVNGSEATQAEYEATMNALLNRGVDTNNDTKLTGNELMNYIYNASEEELKALDEELSAQFSKENSVEEDKDVTEEEAAAEIAETEEAAKIATALESGDLSTLSQMGIDLQTGKYGVEGLTTASQIMREVFELDYYSDEGQAVWNKLVEINQSYTDTAITTQKDSEGSPIVLAYQKIYLSAPQEAAQEDASEETSGEASGEGDATDAMYESTVGKREDAVQ